jgi:acyl-CoA reductase-like NAD-dependent aldehyde dehydrogenase
MKFLALSLSTLILLCAAFSSNATAQRDYFTPEEIELIRDAQKIDDRMSTLTKIIDRRFDALKIDVGGAKISAKETEKWGVLPQATRAQLLLDIKRILQKAIDDIDSLAERPDSAILPDPDDKKSKQSFKDLFPKAVRHLASAAKRYQPALKGELDKPNSGSEQGSVLDSLEFCDQIIAAVEKLPAETMPAKKSKN